MKTLLLATLTLCAVSPAQNSEFTTPVETTLTEVRAFPDAYRNVQVTFVAQFASLGKLANPFFTRFTPSDFANFYVWADDQPIWRRDSYQDIFGNLFYSKLGEQLQEVFDLQMYQRIQITGVIRNTFQNQPWIEVDTAVLSHMYRGEQYMNERRWQHAIAELTMAPGAGVPTTVQRAAWQNLGICYLRIGESRQAIECLRTAAALAVKPDIELQTLLSTAESTPGAAIDRVVGQEDLPDHERPMWEAFETETATPGARAMR
jgi:tetratricopeptide (TPR) repeat protein